MSEASEKLEAVCRDFEASAAMLNIPVQHILVFQGRMYQAARAVLAERTKLQHALRWALKEGAKQSRYADDGKLELRDHGCGCCSGEIEPPEELRAVLLEAVQPIPPPTEQTT